MTVAEPRLRVLIVDLSKRFGGADIRVAQTVAHLEGRCDIVAAVLAGSPVDRDLTAAGRRTVRIDRRRHDPRIVLDLVRAMRRLRPCVVDLHNPQSQLWGILAASIAGVPGRLITVHTVYRVAHRGRMRQFGHEMVLRLARVLGARFLAVSRSIREYVEGLWPRPGPVRLSYNAMPPLEGPIPPAGLRTALGIPPATPLVGVVGRLERVKGHDVLVEAVALLRDRGVPLAVVAVGEGSEAAAIRAKVRERGLEGWFHLVGFRRDIPSVLAEIDLFCAPSRSEGLPYAALEAARQGVPIVATAVDGLAEVLEDGGTALLVPPEQPDRLAAALERALADGPLRRRIGDAGRAMVETRFRMTRMADETYEAYRALCPEASGT